VFAALLADTNDSRPDLLVAGSDGLMLTKMMATAVFPARGAWSGAHQRS
jgi:hypothetical protein